MKPDPDGQPAVTKWKVMGRGRWGGQPENPSGAEAAQDAEQGLRVESASSVPSPLVGEGQGEGYTTNSELDGHPSPHPSPTRGEGAHPSWGKGVNSQQAHDEAHHLTWLALEPVTGRTHQLRVHCAEQGWPIVGDSIYGTQASLRSLRKEDAPRTSGPPLQLHSREIIVPLYKNRDPIKVMAPVPLTMQERLYACGWQGEVFHLVD
jgi:tRNA pseudouridine32 synthase/23S rRNA pseudouridine746 synthase